MSYFLRGYRYVNMLSLDTAAGAVMSALFFASLVSAHILIYGQLALGLTVWIIYTADHLLDARKVKEQASSERHRFHQQHFKTLLVCLLIAVIVDAMLVMYMRRSLLMYGILLSVIVLLYLVVAHVLKILKELFIALIYTLGVILPALADRDHTLDRADVLLMSIFFLVALVNLLVFSWFDRERDRADGYYSFVTFFGERQTVRMIYVFSVLAFAIGVYLIFFIAYDLFAALTVLSMLTLLLVIIVFPRVFAKGDLFRYAGDGVFLLPVVYLLLHRGSL